MKKLVNFKIFFVFKLNTELFQTCCFLYFITNILTFYKINLNSHFVVSVLCKATRNADGFIGLRTSPPSISNNLLNT